jgi:Fe-S-cluster containining protein
MAHGLLRLRFSCSGCGHCCRGLRVPLTLADAAKLPADAVAWLDPDEVDMTGEPESFVLLPEGRRLLVLAQRDGACVFLAGDRCTVYESRPSACRLYPFDVTLGRKHGIRRLKLLSPNLCVGDTRGFTDPQKLSQEYRVHRAELVAHVESVQAFNRQQAHRRRWGLPMLAATYLLTPTARER